MADEKQGQDKGEPKPPDKPAPANPKDTAAPRPINESEENKQRGQNNG